MKNEKLCIVAASLCVSWSGASSADNGLCSSSETVIFHCELANRTAAICQTKDSRSFIYRHARKSGIDLEVSGAGAEPKTRFYFSNTPYAGGGEAHIRFSRGKYDYYLYDRVVRHDDGPETSAGMVIYKARKRVSSLHCTNDASIHQNAYSDMETEAYEDIDN